jgi:regulatory subunit for Cdc7p protein kinase
MIEVDDAEARRYGLQRRSGAPPTAFQKKLEAARTAPKQTEKAQRENLETIRLWQRHYRKMFPSFVFYFESIPDDVKTKVLRQVMTLGAREVRFFSREATHVITMRPIPTEIDSSSSSNPKSTTTINPAQLETKKSIFDAALRKTTSTGDILYKARELGMKIWSAEKLQRMLHTMFNTDTGEQPLEYPTRHGAATASAKQAGRQADLGKLLQNERLNGPLDRDYSVATQDLIQLRGYYIYIHDMDELTRPVMVREYAKAAKKEDGKWPQFRVSGVGKCPFVADPHHTRKLQEQEREEQRARAAKTVAARTRAATALEEKRALGENNNLARRASTTEHTTAKEEAKPLEPPKMIPTKRGNTDSMPPMFGSAQANVRAVPRLAGGEPVASGIQPSNITSAIRSQMISSTAAAPGARAGNSKEVNQLKRKVLEKNNNPAAMEDMRAALNQEYAQPPRAAKRKAQDALGLIKEEDVIGDEERQARKAAVIRRRKTAEKELKPGYCENCREKFNDFDEVCIQSMMSVLRRLIINSTSSHESTASLR